MADDVRARQVGVSAGPAGTDRSPRQKRGWAVCLVAASTVGLIVMTVGLWYPSVPLLGCVELILLILLCTGVAAMRRKDTGRAARVHAPMGHTATATKSGHVPSEETGRPGFGAETLSKPEPAAAADTRSGATRPTALIVIQEPEPLRRRDHVTLRDDQPYHELRASSAETAEQIRALMEADGWLVRVEQFVER